MIILNETQKDQVKGMYGQWKALEPIKIKNNLWMLSEVILEDDDFSGVFDVLNDCEQREVLESELIVIEL